MDIAEESRTCGAFLWVRQVIPTPVRGPEMSYSFRWFLARVLEAGESSFRVSIPEILLVKLLAHVSERHNAESHGAPVPVCPNPVPVASDCAPQNRRRID